MERLCGKRISSKSIKGSGRFKESIAPIHVPSLIIFQLRAAVHKTNKCIPLYNCSVQAGYPETADDSISEFIDVHGNLITDPESMLIAKYTADDNPDVGLYSGDFLIIDTSKEPKTGKLNLYMKASDYFLLQQPAHNNARFVGIVRKVIHRL